MVLSCSFGFVLILVFNETVNIKCENFKTLYILKFHKFSWFSIIWKGFFSMNLKIIRHRFSDWNPFEPFFRCHHFKPNWFRWLLNRNILLFIRKGRRLNIILSLLIFPCPFFLRNYTWLCVIRTWTWF